MTAPVASMSESAAGPIVDDTRAAIRRCPPVLIRRARMYKKSTSIERMSLIFDTPDPLQDRLPAVVALSLGALIDVPLSHEGLGPFREILV